MNCLHNFTISPFYYKINFFLKIFPLNNNKRHAKSIILPLLFVFCQNQSFILYYSKFKSMQNSHFTFYARTLFFYYVFQSVTRTYNRPHCNRKRLCRLLPDDVYRFDLPVNAALVYHHVGAVYMQKRRLHVPNRSVTPEGNPVL